MITVLGYVPFVVVQGIGRPWAATKFVLVNGALTIALTLLLIPRAGIVGASEAFALAQLLVMPWFIWRVNRELKVSFGSLLKIAYLKPFVCGSVAFALLLLFRTLAGSAFNLILAVAFVLIAYCILAFFIAMDSQERFQVSRQVMSILRPSRRPVGV